MFACPHCNQLTISRKVKLNLATWIPYNCAACDRPLGVPLIKATIAWMPFILSMSTAQFLDGFDAPVLVTLCGIATVVLLSYYVPIVKR